MSAWWLERRASGWVIRWREGGRGSTKHASAAYPNRAEATVAALALAARLPVAPRTRSRRSVIRPLQPLSVAQVLMAWQDDRASRDRGDRPGSDHYRADVATRVQAAADQMGIRSVSDLTVEAIRRVRGVVGARTLAYVAAVLRWHARSSHVAPPPGVLDELRPLPSRPSRNDLLDDARYRAALEVAEQVGCGLLIECLATYGWRPITACRLTWRDVRGDGTIRLSVKHAGDHRHPLFPAHLRALNGQMGLPDDPVFRCPQTGQGWRCGASADQLTSWWRTHCQPVALQPIYALKRRAISRMLAGDQPWDRPLTVADAKLFTGHLTESQVLRYARTSQDRARTLVQGGTGGGTGQHMATHGEPGATA